MGVKRFKQDLFVSLQKKNCNNLLAIEVKNRVCNSFANPL